MRKVVAIVVLLAITPVISSLASIGDESQAAVRSFSQDESTGPYNPNLPRD
jgi:hypothetical protein